MTLQTRDPADTTMMGVVHDALRRDLARTETALAGTPPPDDARRAALAEHVQWMMTFLHHHHRTEDEGLWPLVRSRNPDGAALLDNMQAQHAAVLGAMHQVEAAAARYASDDGARGQLQDALSQLCAVLLPHLRQEEDQAMPLVSASITDADWRRWDQSNNVKGKSLRQLGEEGHWLMDGLDADRYDHLVHLVPAPVRMVLLKGFARRYRVAARRRWGSAVMIGPQHRPIYT